ncbi:uncharacterized protein BX664DRAFT_356568 [Halteromyces radiatus]|uniref:uncharacterized protein n=1 Tax=Halteromyces radiatus TaxID=101107 RepID=UPI00222078DE|nr:uncharacterized protein BX664DRAFT_356568 [Halteromyces radiatus]KAI8097311.1 hypothetical protein BX664DRAFT_356568 [Halteromyces radiatus]
MITLNIKNSRQESIDAQKGNKNRFNSFAPIRSNTSVSWLIDGQDYFEAVINGISSAQSFMYISSWWLTPKLYLRRPANEDNNRQYQLDLLLKKKAREGVDIFVILYKDLHGMGSEYTFKILTALSPRIHVIRCPDVPLLWSYHEKYLIIDGKRSFVGGFDLSFARYDTVDHVLSDYPSTNRPSEMFPGQDYNNPRVRDFQRVSHAGETLVDRTVIPRMPWHDISMFMEGGVTIDLIHQFEVRWNYLRNLKMLKGLKLPALPLERIVAVNHLSNNSNSINNDFGGTNQVQVVRSASNWNTDVSHEKSIYQAYLDLIAEAQHYIYIENQYFISSVDQDNMILNKVGKALVERIKLAHLKGENFRVIVVLPLLPGFQGDLTSFESSAVRSIMHLQYISISRGEDSINKRLEQAGINPSDYIEWYSLRNYDKIIPPLKKSRLAHLSSMIFRHRHRHQLQQNRDIDYFVSEMIYIHSKVVIVDDKRALIGSANVNDRSLLGDRDAEVAVIVEDTEYVPSFMNGKKYEAGKSILDLRLRIWKEHLGLLEVEDWEDLSLPGLEQDDSEMAERQVMDPLSDIMYQILWRNKAKRNTLIYRDVFHCVPDDTIFTYDQHTAFVPDSKRIPYGHAPGFNNTPSDNNATTIQAKLDKIRGHLVQFPLDYLNQSDIITRNVWEMVTPLVIFT